MQTFKIPYAGARFTNTYVENRRGKNPEKRREKSMPSSVANSMRACWQLTKQYTQNSLWWHPIPVRGVGGWNYRNAETEPFPKALRRTCSESVGNLSLSV